MTTPDLFDVQLLNRDDLPYFYPIDDQIRYQHNLASQPASWPWRNKTIHYTLNSLGYRAPEFNTVNWAESIICFGCSMTFGIGVDQNETWPQQLSEIMGIPVVNLAVPGGSIQINWANSVRLISAGIKPRAVIYHWPDASRSCEFLKAQPVDHWGIWKFSQGKDVSAALGTAWMMNPTHYQTMAELMIQSLQWPCPRVDLTWSNELNCKGVQHRNFKLDLARDLQHPGPLSHLAFATMTARDLKNLKI